MKITIVGTVSNSRGYFTKGDQVDWPEATAQPLVDAGAAVEGWQEFEDELKVSEAARELAEEKNISLEHIEGSGKEGKIIKPDVEAAIEAAVEDEEEEEEEDES